MIEGCHTALITPFDDDVVDYDGIHSLVRYQIENGITGIVATGTTGESPTLSWDEHNRIIEEISGYIHGRVQLVVGTGSNSTKEATECTRHAAEFGADAVLLVDPYYNGPSSIEIRKEYISPIAESVPNTQIIPYVVPSRTGTQLLPEDLGILNQTYQNVCTVKEATGNLDNMRRVRTCCGPDFSIMSGDDGLTFKMMTDSGIKASGAISVYSNLVPRAVVDLVGLVRNGQMDEAEQLNAVLDPLFQMVSVTTTEETPYGKVQCKAKNPLAVKTLMHILGMPSGYCRKPLGKLSWKGLTAILGAAREVQNKSPEIFHPIAEFFDVDIDQRLNSSQYWEGLYYESY